MDFRDRWLQFRRNYKIQNGGSNDDYFRLNSKFFIQIAWKYQFFKIKKIFFEKTDKQKILKNIYIYYSFKYGVHA